MTTGLRIRHLIDACEDTAEAAGCSPCVAALEVVLHWLQHTNMALTLEIEIAQEDDGRWIAEVSDLAGVMTYGQTRDEAIARVQALALRVIAERLEHAEVPAELLAVTFRAA
jgi:predicted RNase H-like HicB family nuclease